MKKFTQSLLDMTHIPYMLVKIHQLITNVDSRQSGHNNYSLRRYAVVSIILIDNAAVWSNISRQQIVVY